MWRKSQQTAAQNPQLHVWAKLRIIIIFIIFSGLRVHLVLQPLLAYCTSPTIDDTDCGAMGGMKIGRGNRSSQRKPAPVPLCPPQIPHDLTRARTRAAAVGSQRLTA
jgi:hypothetical protein